MRFRSLGMAVMALALGCGNEAAEICAPPQTTAPSVIPVTAAASEPDPMPAPPAPAKPAKAVTPATRPAVVPAAPKAPRTVKAPISPAGQPKEDADALLAEVKAQSMAMSTFKAMLASTEMRWDKSRPPLNTQIALTYQNPGQYRFEMVKSTKASNNGTRLVYKQGDSQATVKPGGILGVLTLSFAVTDAQILTDNGYRLDQITLEGVLNRLSGGGYHAEKAGTTTLGGETITVLKVTTDRNSLDPHIAYEHLGYDARKTYRLWTAYGKTEYGLPQHLLHQIAITSVTPNAPVSANDFKL